MVYVILTFGCDSTYVLLYKRYTDVWRNKVITEAKMISCIKIKPFFVKDKYLDIKDWIQHLQDSELVPTIWQLKEADMSSLLSP